MAEDKNVGKLDGITRVILGIVSLGFLVVHFVGEGILPIYGIIILVILVPFFLKTGITLVCPIMKAMDMSTRKSEDD